MGLNFLKNPVTDSDPDRTSGYQAMTSNVLNRDLGLILDLANWTSPGFVNVTNNTIENI